MPQVGEIAFHVQGDIGGTGISRFRFVRQDSAAISGADCNAAAAAARQFLFAQASNMATTITWTCVSQVNIYDVASGLVQGPLIVSSLPATVTGTGGVNGPAGVGVRCNWKTSTLSGRRLLKGCVFIAPLTGASYISSGQVASAIVTGVNNAAAAYLTAMTTAVLYPVIWHRPKKGTSSGGLTGIIYAGAANPVPCSLRSRRT